MQAARIMTLVAAGMAASCRPAQEEPRSTAAQALAQPAAVSTTAPAQTLSAASTGYDNAEQARRIREESQRLGISSLGKPTQGGADDEPPEERLTDEEGMIRTRAMAQDFAAQRRAIERTKPRVVGLEGSTPIILSTATQGGPLEEAPPPGPKDPVKK